MKILVVLLDCPLPNSLLGDDRLVNLRRLMDAGVHGPFVGNDHGETRTHARAWTPVEVIRHGLQDGDGIDVEFVEIGLDRMPTVDGPKVAARSPHDLDGDLGGLLEELDEETVILVLSEAGENVDEGSPTYGGAFILAGPGLPAIGEIDGVDALDLAQSLVSLSRSDLAEPIHGDSPLRRLLASGEAESGGFDDEELVRDRLRGLGYVA